MSAVGDWGGWVWVKVVRKYKPSVIGWESTGCNYSTVATVSYSDCIYIGKLLREWILKSSNHMEEKSFL